MFKFDTMKLSQTTAKLGVNECYGVVSVQDSRGNEVYITLDDIKLLYETVEQIKRECYEFGKVA